MQTPALDQLTTEIANGPAKASDARGRFTQLVAYLRDDPDGVVTKHLRPLARIVLNWALGALLKAVRA